MKSHVGRQCYLPHTLIQGIKATIQVLTNQAGQIPGEWSQRTSIVGQLQRLATVDLVEYDPDLYFQHYTRPKEQGEKFKVSAKTVGEQKVSAQTERERVSYFSGEKAYESTTEDLKLQNYKSLVEYSPITDDDHKFDFGQMAIFWLMRLYKHALELLFQIKNYQLDQIEKYNKQITREDNVNTREKNVIDLVKLGIDMNQFKFYHSERPKIESEPSSPKWYDELNALQEWADEMCDQCELAASKITSVVIKNVKKNEEDDKDEVEEKTPAKKSIDREKQATIFLDQFVEAQSDLKERFQNYKDQKIEGIDPDLMYVSFGFWAQSALSCLTKYALASKLSHDQQQSLHFFSANLTKMQTSLQDNDYSPETMSELHRHVAMLMQMKFYQEYCPRVMKEQLAGFKFKLDKMLGEVELKQEYRKKM